MTILKCSSFYEKKVRLLWVMKYIMVMRHVRNKAFWRVWEIKIRNRNCEGWWTILL